MVHNFILNNLHNALSAVSEWLLLKQFFNYIMARPSFNEIIMMISTLY